jgi:hypothetical protein
VQVVVGDQICCPTGGEQEVQVVEVDLMEQEDQEILHQLVLLKEILEEHLLEV